MEIIFLIGRILLGGFFAFNGYNHFKHAESMSGYAESKDIPMPTNSVYVSGAMLLLGGLGLVFGVLPHLSILLLILFLLPTTILMHDFWNVEGEAKQAEKTNFLKNLALVGALLMLLAISTPWMLAL